MLNKLNNWATRNLLEMEFNLHQHLVNLKLFSDFKRSRILPFQRFVDYIEAGNSPFEARGNSKFSEEIFEDPDFSYEPTDQELKWIKEKPDRNYFEDYTDFINLKIRRILDSFPSIPDVFDLENIDKEILHRYFDLQDFIQADKDMIQEYVELLKNGGADNFIPLLDTVTSEGPSMDKNRSAKVNCHLEIFRDCKAFEFFERLSENIQNPLADYSVIYWEMKKDSLIHQHIGNKDFSVFLSRVKGTEFIALKSQKKVSNGKFVPQYSTIKDLIYL